MNDAPSHDVVTVHAPAARYARLLQTLRGDAPTIHTVAVLTAALIESRSDEQVMRQENIRRNADLLGDLKGYSTRQIKGRFGSLENPSVVVNVPRGRVVELGVKYEQDAVIFGYRKGGQRLGMGLEWICTNEADGTVGHALATRRMLLVPHARDEDRKHVNDGTENAVFSIHSNGHPFEIPFFDEDAGREEDFRGGRVLTYRSADIPAHARAALRTYLDAEAELAEALRERSRTGHYLYVRRGIVGNARTALFRAMGDWKPFPLLWERTW